MILRKPYGFLIKHFKIINLILLVPILYLTFKFGDIAEFFRNYVAAKYTTSESMIAGTYITLLMYLALIGMITINLIIYVLMKNKKKSTIEYALTSIYYIVLLVMTLIFYNTMTGIEISDIDATIINLVRDIATILPLPGYLILLLTLFKTIGFNIKTFRFDNNLDLQVTEEDEAEFELKVGADSYVIKKNIVHSLRELKYYVLENKFVFTCIGAVLIIVLVISLFMNFGVYNKKYRINQSFALDSFTIAVQDSYITDVDYGGQKIANNKYYLAVKINIQNKSLKAESIDKSNFRIYVKNKILYPSYDRSSRFIDLGNNYQGNSIPSNNLDTYVLVYEINKSLIKNSYQMKILSSLKYDSGKLIPSYKKIKIKPKNIVTKETVSKNNIGDKINFNKTFLGNTEYILNDIEIAKKYDYTYEQCVTNDNCNTMRNTLVPGPGKALVIIKDKITYDKTTSYYKNSKRNFYGDFATIKYDYENSSDQSKKLTTTLTNVTPNGVKGKKIYEVSSLILNGENKQLIFTIRNKEIVIDIEK